MSQQQLVSNLQRALPPGTEAVTGAAAHQGDRRTSSQKALSFFSTFLLVFAVVALLVGAFMIFNTFSITVAQRTRENGLLRALGASRRQVLASVLLEALAVGVIAVAARAGRRGRGGGRPQGAARRGSGSACPRGSLVLNAQHGRRLAGWSGSASR